MLIGLVGVGLISGLTAAGPGPVPVLGAAAALGVYWLVMRRLARRSTPEISRHGAGREGLLGGAIGLGFVLLSTLLIVLFGGYSFAWAGHGFFAIVASAVAVQAAAAVTEELMFRGLALQALEQLWGSRAAIVITGLFFGIAHLWAPNATGWSSLSIALEAGVMLGAAFLWRRSIWFVAGLHFAWNLMEQLLGIPVSGQTPEGLFTVEVRGGAWLTGGPTGQAPALCDRCDVAGQGILYCPDSSDIPESMANWTSDTFTVLGTSNMIQPRLSRPGGLSRRSSSTARPSRRRTPC
ncbi:CPBP family intramembrane glutamic endopeptidase [Streptomyces sp. NPDC005385]|uniref:CPBP family intramembrane glutamic endopeptidase n=1 Tax=Streptomyces sp. NPDC005385 TaxID=3157039 RepID=UPI0033B246B8